MMDACVRIKRVENGFEVEMRDPEIEKSNMKAEGPYKSPEKTYVFTTMPKLMAFLRKQLPEALAKRDDEYEEGFAMAAKEDS